MNEEMKTQDEALEQETSLQEEAQQTSEATNQEVSSSDELAEEPASEPTTEERLQSELDKLKDTHLRLVAEYDNYRKRTLKEKSELIRSGGEKALTDLLPVVDDLDIALVNLDKATDLDALKEGIHLIYSKFVDYLSRQGVTAIETAEQPFDDELHEAIATFPAPEEALKGKIIDCVKKGYRLHDKVLRHASVVVGQ